ncbi:hypothetical protein HanPI659440_Chr15g0612761 [Helianthus annuus]|nr:hypothetical protein HanPI659440_Chr15g0612761 [Helianthus annuus]
MDTEFYNAFATTPTNPSDIAKTMTMENETGTMQKPPKLMGIEDYHGWKKRFENWVQANHLKAWESIETQYERPQNSVGVDKIISEFNEQERESYKAEKMMINLLQQAVKEDIFVLLQHDESAYSIWEALQKKFEGSTEMLQSKAALLKKEFELFTCMHGETTKTLIERYCHLVRPMSQLKITKTPTEWVEKHADALPQKEWGTYLMILKNFGQFSRLSIAQFIEKLEAQDLEQQKIARMNSSSHQQDIKLYYKGNVQTVEASPKIQTALVQETQPEHLVQAQSTLVDFQM